MVFKLLPLITAIAFTLSSNVLDNVNRIEVHNYCPVIKGCEQPGTHVLCLHNPNNFAWAGPACSHIGNITITEKIAARILKVFNAFRRKIALGIETGKNGKLLPKGYGLFALDWDPELATFAQLWANQCRFQHDICHATRKFPYPGQIIGLQRLKFPSWEPLRNADEPPNEMPRKVTHAILNLLKVWYAIKNKVSEEDVNTSSQHQYLQIVNGKTTHVGCGVSVFLEFSYNDLKVDMYYNTVLLVCNFSEKVRVGTPAYTTTNVQKNNNNALRYDTNNCGCPPGTVPRQDSCLCQPKQTLKNPPICKDGSCLPNIVILPFLTVEDVLPVLPIPKPKMNVLRQKQAQTINRGHFHSTTLPPESRRLINNISKPIKYESPIISSRSNKQLFHGKSIFARAKIFELPHKSTVLSNEKDVWMNGHRKRRPMLTDVEPRKNFKDAKEFLTLYLRSKWSNKSMPLDIENTPNYSHMRPLQFYDNEKALITTQSNTNDYFDELNDDNFGNVDYDFSEHKLLMLLEALEKEVDQIKFDDVKRDILNEKIKKIYDTLQKIQEKDSPGVDKLTQNYLQTNFPTNREVMQLHHLEEDYRRRLNQANDYKQAVDEIVDHNNLGLQRAEQFNRPVQIPEEYKSINTRHLEQEFKIPQNRLEGYKQIDENDFDHLLSNGEILLKRPVESPDMAAYDNQNIRKLYSEFNDKMVRDNVEAVNNFRSTDFGKPLQDNVLEKHPFDNRRDYNIYIHDNTRPVIPVSQSHNNIIYRGDRSYQESSLDGATRALHGY